MTKAVKKKEVINFNTNKSDKKIQIKALKTKFLSVVCCPRCVRQAFFILYPACENNS